jgi:hypothetical protein
VAALAGSVVQAGAAAADTDCPTFQAVGFTWDTKFNDGGVTLCHGWDGSKAAYLQIIDLSAGAKIRVASEIDSVSSTPWQGDTRFVKRNVPSWFNWVAFGGQVTDPSPVKLFSALNASFFVDDGNLDATTRLSLPEMVDYSVRSYGWALHSPGTGEQRDSAWDVDKVRLDLSTPYPNEAPPSPQNQYAAICSFPTHYSTTDPIFMNFCDNLQYKDAIVGFQPLAGVGGNPTPPGADPRTMVGWDGQSKIFTVQFPSATLNETQAFLQSLGSTSEIQLDGGCSAAFHAGARSTGFDGVDWDGESIPGVCPREVPEVLAVYTSTDAT